jgi:hypothetical protein
MINGGVMMEMTILQTEHVIRRQARRNLSNQDIWFVLEHGRRVHCAGALHIFLGRRDIPGDKPTYQRFAHLEGTVLVCDQQSEELIVITAYRNHHGFKQIRTKTKYVQPARNSASISWLRAKTRFSRHCFELLRRAFGKSAVID